MRTNLIILRSEWIINRVTSLLTRPCNSLQPKLVIQYHLRIPLIFVFIWRSIFVGKWWYHRNLTIFHRCMNFKEHIFTMAILQFSFDDFRFRCVICWLINDMNCSGFYVLWDDCWNRFQLNYSWMQLINFRGNWSRYWMRSKIEHLLAVLCKAILDEQLDAFSWLNKLL